MPLGKPPHTLLKDKILAYTGEPDPTVVLPPRPGEDAAAIRVAPDQLIVVHPDPITGAEKRLGTLAVNVAANDVAVTGARPRWFTLTLILPPSKPVEFLEQVMKEAHEALKRLGATLVGGHTEWSDAVRRPVTVTTAMGLTTQEGLVPTGGARPGDVLILSKPPGLEAAAIASEDLEHLLRERRVPEEYVEEARGYWGKLSLVEEAVALAEKRLVNAMHDPTEGGLVAAGFEVSLASGWGVELWRSRVPVPPAVKAVLGALGADPLKSLSSGSLLAAVPEDRVEEALSVLGKLGLDPAVVGRVREDRGPVLLVREDAGGSVVEEFVEAPVDDFLKRLPG